MLRLMLFRHAKASWDEPALPDEKRPLTARGRGEADAMGKLLAARGLIPDIVLCSPARRAQQTLELALPHWTPRPDVRTTAGIYGAINDSYLEAVRSFGAGERLMIVGHNPAMQESAVLLAGQGAGDAIGRLRAGFKTGAVAVIDFDVADWSAVERRSGTLADYIEPN